MKRVDHLGVVFIPTLKGRAVREKGQRVCEDVRRRDRLREASSGVSEVQEPDHFEELRKIDAQLEEKSRLDQEERASKSKVAGEGKETRRQAMETYVETRKRGNSEEDDGNEGCSKASCSGEKRRRTGANLLDYLQMSF